MRHPRGGRRGPRHRADRAIDRREVPVARAVGREALVDVGREQSQLGDRSAHPGRSARQPQILQHQVDGEAGLVAVVGGARRDEARDGAVRRQRPACAGGGRCDVEERLVQRPRCSASTKASPTPIIEMPSSMLLRPSRPVPSRPRRSAPRAAHHLQQRLDLAQVGLGAADHEGQRAGLRADHAAGARRIERAQLAARDELMQRPRIERIDRRAVDEQRQPLGRRERPVSPS